MASQEKIGDVLLFGDPQLFRHAYGGVSALPA